MVRRLAIVSCAVSLLMAVAAAQAISASATAAPGSFRGQATFPPPHFSPNAITGAPYSAEQVSEHTQTLADGTHITQPGRTERMYRDSSGRTRVERPMFFSSMMRQDLPLPVVVEITDPVAGCQYILDDQNHVAHRFTLPQRGVTTSQSTSTVRTTGMTTTGSAVGVGVAVGGSTAGTTARTESWSGGEARPQYSSESLGSQPIDGLMAEGRRNTTTYPAGSMGNDRPIVTTTEIWTSPELKIMVLMKSDDPRNGENNTHLANLSRAEPDAALFQPPPDYKVVDETGPVTITYTRP